MNSGTPQLFDRLIGGLEGLPDVVSTQLTPIRTFVPIVGDAQTWTLQTYRQKDVGDTVFIECVSAEGSLRLAIPPKVTAAIARQREALTGKSRRKSARAAAADRKARGIVPGFMKARAAKRQKGTK